MPTQQTPTQPRGADLIDGPTRCLLVRPEFLHDTTFYSLKDMFRLTGARSAAPPLGLCILPNLLPAHWEIRLVDQDIEPLTDEQLQWANIVMVSGIGSQQITMDRVIARAQAFGRIVVVGGSGPSLQPDLFTHADFVVSGEAEDTVPKLLEDLREGKTSGMYKSAGQAVLKGSPTPRYDLLDLQAYMFVGVCYCRGCPFACEFCAQIEVFGRTPRTKSPEEVVADLQRLYDLGRRGMLDFGYDNLIGDPKDAKMVLQAMAEWSEAHNNPFFYSTEATVNLARHPDILALMARNDFRYLFVGLETADDDVLEQTQKGQNKTLPPEEAVRIFNSYGLIVNTGLIIGFDSESPDTAANIIEMVKKTGVFPALVLPLHALPNTQLSRRLQTEGRLFGEGDIEITREDRTDTATTGLNFVTRRPRLDVLRDLTRLLDELYEPESFYQRLGLTLAWIKPSPKYRPSLKELVQMVKAFFIVATSTGMNAGTARRFWPAFFKVLFTKPKALEVVVGQAAMHTNYFNRSQSYIAAVQEEIELVERVGETEFNQKRLPASDRVVREMTSTARAARSL